MEISSVLSTTAFHHQIFTHPLPSSFPIVPSFSPSTPRASFTNLTSTTTSTPLKEPNPTRPHSKSYLQRQSALLQVQESPDLSSSLQEFGGILKPQDLNVILRQFGKAGKWHLLSQLFDWMQHHGKTNGSSYSTYMKVMGKKLNPVKALEIYNSIPDKPTKVNVFICNSLLSCLVRNGKFESGVKLFDKMKQEGLAPNSVTYNTLLAGCIRMKNGHSKALELIKELKYNDLQMDSVMYGTLLAVCASNGLCDEAQNYFSQMREEGHSPNVYHYSSLLNAYSYGGDYRKSDELMEEMKSSGLAPNKVILTTLLKVYVRGGLFEKARKLLSELEALGYAEDEMPYCLLMDGLSKAGRLDEARAVFAEMQEKCVKSDGYSHSIMISALCRGGLFEEAKELAQDFEAKYNKYDLVMLNTMLCAYCRAGDMESVMQTMKKMDELAISPDYSTFHILIKYFCKEKLYLLAYRTMVDMHGKGYHPEEELCSSLIFQLGKMKAHSEAFSVYNMLRYSKRTMCKALHEKILRVLIAGKLFKDAYVVVKDNAQHISRPSIKKFATAFMKLGSINLINDVLKVIHASGYKIDQGLFEIAISRYIAQPEKKELLLQLLQWMPGQGYVVDSTTRNLILKNSELFGRQLTAEILSKQHIMSKGVKA
ncbi:Pentatricopeptide repeat-containing protein [Hibiscus syriacus]|uniref:Pentatricopeptide repeat-containing protein n=1 Tax=Hibiscus syriacus TaxID=106335 RepID=A0A6A2Y691_HIBSY|nr:pentatricopeptide repeat-containing protein At1g10910, chloroplastic [Hibiscus syriacus]XP_039039804.1 pentatricopeptide repeat-containing protein At1g10910, chloroplastic [Hibiscus syriacus]KAE8668389.1 Pentatricopeptide repeat-containing protein [Hibiscus syriacus]